MPLDNHIACRASPVTIIGEPGAATAQRMRRALLAIAALDPGADELDALMALSDAQQIAEEALQNLS